MRTLFAVLSASIVMSTDNLFVGIGFGSVVVYFLFKEIRNAN